MVDKNALISVILPIYNAMPYLGQALDSVQAQTHRNLEIICVNDGSTDDSLAVIEAHAAVDDRIIIVDKKNEGYGASMNRGIAEAHGEWIALVEPDDWIEPRMYEDMLEFAASFGGEGDAIDIVKSPYWSITYSGTRRERKCQCPYKYEVKQSERVGSIHDVIALCYHHPSIWSAIYRKSFIDENDIRFLPIPGAGWADNPFFIETMLRARGVVFLDNSYYCYRADSVVQAESFHRQNPLIPFERWNQMLDIIEACGGDAYDDVLKAHYSRGFLYMGGVFESTSPDDDSKIAEATRKMCMRMKPELVDEMANVKPGTRRLFAEMRDMPEPQQHYARYIGFLVSQTIQDFRTIGPRDSIEAIVGFASRYRKRSGSR